MSIERQRLNGLQDRKLELGGKRSKSTPTKEGDIGQRATLYKGLVEGVVVASMALEGMSGGRATPEMLEATTGQIRAGRREAVIAGFDLGGFDLVVKDKITRLKEQAAEEAEFEALERQARMGEVPPVTDIVNFGFRVTNPRFSPAPSTEVVPE